MAEPRSSMKSVGKGVGETRLWSNVNFKYIFELLFKLSIDLPIEMDKEFSKDLLCDYNFFFAHKPNRPYMKQLPSFYDFDFWAGKIDRS
jgi:hypothetical protein